MDPRRDRRRVSTLLERGEQAAVEPHFGLDCGFVGAGGAREPLDLQREQRVAAQARAGQEHDESHLLRSRRDHGHDQAALAVADQTDPPGIDSLAGSQETHGRLSIAREVLGGGGREASARAADAAIVETEHRDPHAREMVSQHQERAMPEHRLVPVLGTGSGDQCHRWEGPGAPRVVKVPARLTPAARFSTLTVSSA